jgi:AbrB family looped-hinge helix DNA binding protein
VKLDTAGRIVIPAELRREAGISPGQTLILRREGNRFSLMTVKEALDEARNAVRRYLPNDVDLVAELRAFRQQDRTFD